MEAQIIAAGASYFTVQPVLDANGEPMKDPSGAPVVSTLRINATMGQVVTDMTQHEFDRLQVLGAVRTPSSEPIVPDIPLPTPFGVPMPDEKGNLRAFAGPVMGDPKPTAGLPDIELTTAAGALTPEESARLAEEALVGAGDDESGAAIAERDYEGSSKPSLEAEVERRRAEGRTITVEGTGSGGNIIKDDLVLALEEDDEAAARES